MIDPLADFPGYALKRASSNMWSVLSKRLGLIGLSVTDATILILVDANLELTQTELCKALDINKANMTPRISKLVNAGLIARRRLGKRQDGRSHFLALTDDGRMKKGEAYAIMESHEAFLRDRIAPEYIDHFVPALRQLWDSADRQE